MLVMAAACGSVPQGQGVTGWQRLPDDPYPTSLPAATVGPNGRIYILAPKYIDNSSNLQTYDVRTRRWSDSSSVPAYDHDALVAVGNRLYAVGGEVRGLPNGGSPTDVYSLRRRAWQPAVLSVAGHLGGAAALGHDGRIYLMGGGYGGWVLEAFDSRIETWTLLPHAPYSVNRPAAVTGPDGRIYMLGGTTVNLRGHLSTVNTVQVYNPRTRQWTLAAPMPTARTALAAMTATDGRIYAIGGSHDPIGLVVNYQPGHPVALGTVEIYDPRTNHWSRGPRLLDPQYNLAAVMGPDGKIYAIGGNVSATIETLQVSAGAGRE
jgi:N-acetylneuraminic acid mutarotase